MDSILEMDISDPALPSFDSGILLSVLGESVEDLIGRFIPDERSHRNLENQILRVRSVLIPGSSRFAGCGFEDGFVSVGLQRIFILSGLQDH